MLINFPVQLFNSKTRLSTS